MTYSIYLDEKYLWSSIEMGGSEYSIIDPSLNMQINNAGSFTFSIASNHPLYNSIYLLKSVIVIMHDSIEIWRGRPLKFEDDSDKIRKVTCEGELAYLNDTATWPHDAIKTRSVKDWMKAIFDHYNGAYGNYKAIPEHTLLMGNVVGYDGSERVKVDANDNWHTDASELFDELLGNISGFIRVRHSNNGKITDPGYVDIYATGSDTTSQMIEFGINMLDYARTDDGNNMATAIIPYGGTVSNIAKSDQFIKGGINPNTGDIDDSFGSQGWYRLKEAVSITDGVNKITIDFNAAGIENIVDTGSVFFYKNSEIKHDNYLGRVRVDLHDHTSHDNWYYPNRVTQTFDIPSGAKYLVVTRYAVPVNTYSVSFGKTRTFDFNADGTEKLTIGGLGNDVEYVKDDTSYNKYGLITNIISYDINDDWEKLKTAAQTTLPSVIKIGQSFDISAINMRYLGYDVDDFQIGDLVRISASPYGIDSYFQITEISLDLDDPASDTYGFGLIGDSLTGAYVSNNSKTSGTSVNEKIDNASAILSANISNNYVSKAELNTITSDLNSKISTLESSITNLEKRVTDLESKENKS